MSGLYTRRLRDGSVSQAAVRRTDDIPEALQELALSRPTRALVLAVYYPDEDINPPSRVWTSTVSWAVTVDIRTLGEKKRYLAKVPIYPLVTGLFDEDIRIPRAAAIDADQGTLATESSGPSGPRPSDAAATDGDIVMLDFEDGDPKKPFVMPFGPPHPRNNNKPAVADGRVRRIRHNGTIIEIDKDGNVTIDASAAKTDALAVDGSQVANASGGNITIKTNASPGLLNLQEATDFLIKGTTYWTEFQKVVDALSAWANTALGTATFSVATGAPVVQAIAAFKLTVAQWLSTRTKTG